MNLIRSSFALVVLVFVTVAGLLPPAAAQTDRYTEFRQKFKELLAINGVDEMAKLVKAFPDEALKRVDGMCEEMGRGNNEDLEKEFQAMAKAWRTATKTGFVDKVYEYHSGLALDPARKLERAKAYEAFFATLDRHFKNKNGTKDQSVIALCGQEFAAEADKLEAIGDMRLGGRAAGAAAECVDETLRGSQADLRKACEFYGRAIADFEKIELTTYGYYTGLKERQNALIRAGFNVPEGTPAADPSGPKPADPGANAAPSAAIVATTTFELLKGLEDYVRPSFFNDELYQIWPIVQLKEKGSTAKFGAITDSPLIVRTDSAKIGIDLDGDKKPDKQVAMTGNLTPVELELGSADQKRKWAFFFKTGTQDDNFQGLKTNLQPDDRQVLLFCVNAGSMLATINGVQVRVLDDNMDGIYGSAPLTYSYQGLSANMFQADMDSIVVGDSKRARPWSQYQEIGGTWYELASDKGGLELKATPVQLETGTLKLVFKGPAPSWLIVKGEGKLENSYFDLIGDTSKPVSVPAGNYQLLCGEIAQGKKQQMVKCLIMKGPRTPPWSVKPGAETVVTLGAPFTFEFDTKKEDESVTVKGSSVAIAGVSGERYERLWSCAPRPEVSIRRAGTKKGSKPEKMGMVLDLNETKEDGTFKYTMADTWRPTDTAFPIKKGDSVEVQLTEKKNKLFGEIESAWK